MKLFFIIILFIFSSCFAQKSNSEKDPVFTGSPSYNITATHITNWNYAYSKSLLTFTRAQVDSAIKSNASTGNIDAYTKTQSDAMYQLKLSLSTASDYFSGNLSKRNFATDARNAIASEGYLKTEKDSLFFASVAAKILQQDVDKWNNAKPVSSSFTGTDTKTFTLTYPDGSKTSASFTDNNTSTGIERDSIALQALANYGTKTQNDIYYAPFSHLHTIGNITNLQSTLNLKAGTQQLKDSIKRLNTLIDTLTNRLKLVEQIINSGAWHRTKFGLIIIGNTLTPAQKISIAKLLGLSYLRIKITLETWTGTDRAYEQIVAAGLKVILNINDKDIARDTNGNRIPNAYPTDMIAYSAKLRSVLNKYKPEIAVIENEPINDIYFNAPIENYITELKTAVAICKEYNVKVADGALHIPVILNVKSGFSWPKAADTKKLITAFKTIPLDYVNMHDNSEDGTYTNGDIKQAADYLREQTGKPVIMNEFTFHNPTTAVIASVIKGVKLANLKYFIALSGDGTAETGQAFYNTDESTLNEYGSAYQTAVKN